MAHHGSTPRRVLDAPKSTPLNVWPAYTRTPFVGNVRRDLLSAAPTVKEASLAVRRARGIIATLKSGLKGKAALL